jgi:autotransporter translocation and assembly factor TamB
MMKRAAYWTTACGVFALASAAAPAAAQLSEPVKARIDIRIERADLSFRELQRLVPALEQVTLPEDFAIERLQARGPLTSLTLDFLLRSGTSRLEGTVTGDLTGPQRTAAGRVSFGSVNLARLLERPALPTHFTGSTEFDLAIDTSGRTVAISGTYVVAADRVALAGYSARDIRASGRFEKQAVVIERARVRAYGGTVTAGGRVGLPLGGASTTYTLSGSAADINLTRLPASLALPPLDTDLHLTFRLSDRGDGLTGRVRFRRSEVAGAFVADGAVATFDTRGPAIAYTASGQVAGVDPQRLAKPLDLKMLAGRRFAGELNASFSIEGRGAALEPLTFTLTDSRLFGGSISELGGSATWLDDQLQFSAKGEFERVALSAILQDASLDSSLTGRLDLQGTVREPGGEFQWSDLALNGMVVLTGESVEGIPVERLAFAGAYSERVLRLDQLAVEGRDLSAAANGTLSFNPMVPSRLTYYVDTPQLGGFADVIGASVQGDVKLEGTVTGADVLRIAGTLAGTAVSYQGVEALTLHGTYDVDLPPGSPASASGTTTVEATFVRVAGRTLTEAAVDMSYRDRIVMFDGSAEETDRSFEATGRLHLPPDRPHVVLTAFRFDAPETQWQLPPGREARIEYGGERIAIDDFRLEGPDDQVIVANGTLGQTHEAPLEVRIEGLALSSIDTLLIGEDGVGGRVDASAALRGPVDAPRFDARFSIENGIVRGYRFDELSGTVASTSDTYQFAARLLQDPTSWLTIAGRIPRDFLAADRSGGGMDVTVRSSLVGLGFVGGLTDVVTDVEGTLQADLHLTGTVDVPRLNGQVTVRNGAFRVPLAGTRFHGLDTVVTFEPGVMVLPAFRLLDENGQWLHVEGRLPYQAGQLGQVTIALRSENFEIVDNEVADIQIGADLIVTGTLVTPTLEGTVRITDGEIRVDRILDLQAASYYRVAPVETREPAEVVADAEEGVLREMPGAIDVRLEIPSLLLTGRDLRGPTAIPVGLGDINVSVEGDVRLDKPSREPLRITGDVSTVRGTYEFQGRRFEILRDGQIQFTGLAAIDPLLDITAQRRISGVEANVRIGGTLREPDLALSSVPPLDEADILSLVVFNRPANELVASQQVSLGRRAAALAAGFATSQLTQSVGGALEIDVFEIETDSAVEGLSPVVTVGEQFGDLFVRVRQQFGSSTATQLVLEYEIAEWLRVQSSVSDDSDEQSSLFQHVERSGVNWIFLFSY